MQNNEKAGGDEVKLPAPDLRDYFAGQALAGSGWGKAEFTKEPDLKRFTQNIATYCYAMADFMLAQRAKKEGSQ